MNEKWLSKKIRQHFQYIKLFSFEHCRVQDVPDLFGIVGAGTEFWLELKTIKNTSAKIPWRRGQPAWIGTYLNNGGKVFIGLISKNTIYFLKANNRHTEIFTESVIALIPKYCVSLTSLSENNGNRWKRIEETLLKALGKNPHILPSIASGRCISANPHHGN